MKFPPLMETIFHDGSTDFINPMSPHKIGQEVEIAIRALSGAKISEVKLRIFPDGEERLIPMECSIGKPFQTWKACVVLDKCPFPYRFRIQTQSYVFWLNAFGLHYIIPPDEEDFKLVPGFIAPDWVRKAVFYQIFPDRFKCGRPEISKRARDSSLGLKPSIIKEWRESSENTNLGNEFYGGDLWGIIDGVPYLERLGINAVYLNPIFMAPSNHKYDVTDYENVDSYLGGNDAFAKLSAALARKNIKIILDGVFNHSGIDHYWFQDALKNITSRWAEMYTFRKHPHDYVSWLGCKNLPKLDYSSEKLREIIYRGPDAVAKRWLRPPYGASGWRLDAANMQGCFGTDEGNIEIWREFRQAVKNENPQAYLVGECFFEGNKWLQGDAFDAVMNYKGFTIPMIQWLSKKDLHLHPARLDARQAARWISSVMARIPFEIRNLQYNALSTHDIPRFLSRVNLDERLYRLGVLFQMAFPGVPAIYYGEELGMSSEKDTQNRQPMGWERVDEKKDLFLFLANVIGLRRSLPVLHNGAFAFLTATGEHSAFARFLGEDMIIVAGNASERFVEIEIPVGILGVESGRNFESIAGKSMRAIVDHRRLLLELGPFEGVWLSVVPSKTR